MGEHSTMAKGNWAWQDLGTTDIDAAVAFYTNVFGWNVVPIPMEGFEYRMLYVGELPIGGVNPAGEDGESGWIPYVAHPALEEAISTINDSGGMTHEGSPHHIPGVGRMSYHQDPEGADFALFEGEGDWSSHVMPTMQAPKSAPVWYELQCGDTGKEIPWYQAFTGWGHVEWPMGEGMVYNGLTVGEAPVSGVFNKDAFGESGQPTHWRIYFEAPTTAAETAEAIRAAGGTIVQEPAPIPGTGIFMLAKDPTGALFGVLESEQQ
jgi:predicted enzyme related to lactoylglutathione lyase